MPLTLTIVSSATPAPILTISHVLDRGQATIGRGPDNDWVLVDPEKVLSRKHCFVTYQNGGYYLTDNSTHGVFINRSQQPVGMGRTVRLNDGDLVGLGKYEVQVEITTIAAEAAADRVPVTPAAPIGDLLDDLLRPSSAQPPWANGPLVAGNQSALPEPVSAPSPSVFPEPLQPDPLLQELPAARPAPAVIPEKLDLDDLLQKSGAPAPLPAGSIPIDLDLKDLLGESPAAPAAAGGIPLDLDLRDLLGEPHAPAPGSAEPDHTPPQRVAFRPPQLAKLPAVPDFDLPGPPPQEAETVMEARPSTPIPAPAPSPVTSPAFAPLTPAAADDAQALIQAFLAGAGLPADTRLAAAPTELMRELGLAFRRTVQGVMDVLRARHRIKQVIGVRDQTMIGPRENNPLKIVPDAGKALAILLGPHDAAYLPLAQTVEESLADIQAHELAMVAGMQASLQHLLRRFDPEALAIQMGRTSFLDAVLPGQRKARYWDLYRLLYNEISQSAEEDVWDIFGKEFDRAYQEQSRERDD